MKLIKSAVSAGLLCFAVAAARGDNIVLYNTGVDAAGVPLPDGYTPDPHYSLTVVPSGATVTLVRTSTGGYPVPPYLPDDYLSAWIGPLNPPATDLNGPIGDYHYTTTFSLAGLNPLTASISGQWSTDNEGVDIILNGVSTGQTIPFFDGSSYSFQHWTPFSLTSGFVAGLNTIEFVVHNADPTILDNPTAVRVEMTGTAQVPDGGATVLLLGLGALGFAWAQRTLKP